MSDPEATGEKLDTRFKPGPDPRRAAGRPKGSRNKFTEDFISALAADFETNGEQAIVDCRTESPRDYLKVCAGVISKQVDVTVSDLEKLKDDELIQRIADLEARANAYIDRIGEAEGGEASAAEHTQTSVLPPLH